MAFDNKANVINDISFEDDIHSLAIIGPSGGGKSTLLRIIGGLILPNNGKLWIDNNEITFEENYLQSYRKQVGFVFQQGGLFKHLTVLENIVLPLVKVHNYTTVEAEKKADELLSRFDLISEQQKKPLNLSGGQQQRVSIIRAIASKPKLLLLDEPTSALDPEYTTEVLDIINELKSDGIDFIIVTHEMGFARHACDKVGFLYNGKMLEYGQSDKMFIQPKSLELQQFLSRLLEWHV
jgi:polar amino acid transport system ATP-binding protein